MSLDNGRSLAGRWLRALWLAVVCGARGGTCVSANQRAFAHRIAQPKRRGGVCQDCVHAAGISWSFAGDQVTASSGSSLLMYCAVLLCAVLYHLAIVYLCRECTLNR